MWSEWIGEDFVDNQQEQQRLGFHFVGFVGLYGAAKEEE